MMKKAIKIGMNTPNSSFGNRPKPIRLFPAIKTSSQNDFEQGGYLFPLVMRLCHNSVHGSKTLS